MRNVIIVGCGRVGSELANMLSDNGDNVCIIDLDNEAFSALGAGFNGTMVQGMGYDEEVLVGAGIEECDVLAAVTQRDNTNLMVAEVASKLYDVPLVIARLYNPEHERSYLHLGIDYVCGTSLVAQETFSKIVSGNGDHIETIGDYEILRFALNLSRVGKKGIRVSELERDHEIRVVAFDRADGSLTSIPTSESVLYHGDNVMICIRRSLIPAISKFIQS